MIENAKIMFKNFSGIGSDYNAEGDRNFCVCLDDDLAVAMKEDGWNVKYLKPREEGDISQAFLKVTVRYGNWPPKIVLVSKNNKSLLKEDEVKLLDYAEIDNIDMTITPSEWSRNGRSGVKAYLKTMYVTIAEDEFESKYSDIPGEIGPIGGCGDCHVCDRSCKEDD